VMKSVPLITGLEVAIGIAPSSGSPTW
jgi:hypothetical protein